MFGGKKAPEIAEQDSRGHLYKQTHEYRTLAVIGAINLDKSLAKHAAAGWEMVAASMAGTTHFAYLRRPLVSADPTQ